MKKHYCVHVYPRLIHHEDIKAKSPKEAERIALRQWHPDEYESVEVMITCQFCHLDNDPQNKKCDECGKKL